MGDERTASKPFHMLTPAEKTALRISQNRAIDDRIAESGAAVTPKKAQRPPAKSSAGYIRATPEERAAAKVGSVIRKVQS